MGETSAGPISEQPPSAAPNPAAPSASAEVTAAFDSSTKPEDSSAIQAPPSEPPATQAEQPVPVRHKGLSFLQPGTQPGSLGRLGHFEVLELLGKGGFGIVLKAFDDKLQRLVAIKVLGPQLTGSANARSRFVREARAAAAVNSKYVVSTYEVYEQPIPYLVMEYVVGKSLQDRLDRIEPFATRDILRIGAEIAKGLAAAHKQGLIHRDIKPANILLEPPQQTAGDSSQVMPLGERVDSPESPTVSLPPLGRVKIADFGLARAVDDVGLTQSGLIAGTPLFMSPEQAQGEAIDPRSDLFSLGSVLYTLCTGHPPFKAHTTLGVMNRVCEDTPRPIREINPDIPETLVETVNRLLVKDPAGRFQTAAEVAERLEHHLAHLDDPAPSAQSGGLVGGAITDSLPEGAHPFGQRLADLLPPAAGVRGRGRRLKRTLLAVAGVALVVALGGYLALRSGDSGRAPDDGNGNTQEHAKAGKPRTPEELAALPSPLDGRTRQQIPAALLALAGGGNPAAAPAELVAILGSPGKPGEQEPFHLPANSKGGCIPRAYSPDGKLLVTLGQLAPIRVWDAASGLLRATLPAAGGDCNSGPRFSPDGSRLAVFGEARQIVLWDTRTFEKKHTLTGHTGRVWDACFSPDSSILASVGDDGMVRRWKVAAGEPLGSFRASPAASSRVCFSPSGKALATYDLGSNFGGNPVPGGAAVRLWDVDPNSKKYLKALRQWPIATAFRHAPDDCLLFSPDGKNLLYTADPVKNLIQLAAVDTGAPVRSFQFPGGNKGIFASALLSNGEQLLVGLGMVANPQQTRHTNPRITLTDMRTGKLRGEMAVPFCGDFISAVVSPDGRTVAVGGMDTPRLRLFDLTTLKERVIPSNRVGPVWTVAVRPDGRTIASGSADGTVRLWDLAGWKAGDPQPPVRALTGHTAAVFSVAFSPDGKLLASSGSDGTLRLWDAEGQTVRAIQGGGARNIPSDVAFSADGKILAAGQGNGSVRLWDVASGEERPPLRWHNRPVSSVAFSPDNRFLASASYDRKVHVTDLQTFRKVLTLGPPGDGGAWMKVAFGGDGRTLAYGGWDDTVRLWDLVEKKETVLTGAIPGLAGLAVDPSGRFVAATVGGAVRIWDRNSPTQSLVIGPGPFGGMARQVAFTAEGRFLVVAGVNGTVSILRIPLPPYPATRKQPPLAVTPNKRNEAAAHYTRAVALAGKGKLDEAIASYRKALELIPTSTPAHHGLAGALVRKGKLDEAIASYRKALEFSPSYTLARTGLARVERLAAVQDKIPALLKGDYQPKTNDERLVLAEWCEIKKLYRTSAGLYADAFTANPKLADDLRTAHRYNAACAAALAAQVGEAAAKLDDKERARLRKQARDWLGADLALWTRQLRNGQIAGGRYEVLQRMTRWQQDSDLASLRDQAALAKLPPQERAACAKVWADVAALLTRARLDDLVRARQDVELNPKDAEAHVNLGVALAGRGQWDKAIASQRQAIELDPKNVRAHLNLGVALARKGQWDEAIAYHRKAIKLAPKDATAHIVLSQTLLGKRRYGEAREALARALELLPEKDPLRPFASNLVQNCERFTKLEGRLPRLLKGEDKPANIAERLIFAQLAYDHKHFATAARLWDEALQANPNLAADRQTQHRYNAACAAALAAAGQGKGEAPLDDAAKAKLRRQALDWLRAELTVWGKLLKSGPPQTLQFIVATLSHWQKDTDLAGIRDAAALAKLPAEERLAWGKLWADVAALLTKAATTPKGIVEAGKQLEQARAHARRREWQKAAQAYAAIIDGPVPDSWGHVAFEYAAVLLLAGDQPGYRAICERLVKRSGQLGVRPYHVARVCSLAPGSFTPAERPGELARAELSRNTAYWSLWLQGALYHRAGRYRDALTLLRKSRDDKFNPPDGVAAVRLWLALTHQKLKQPEEARREFEQAEKWLEKVPAGLPPAEEKRLGVHLHNWLEVQVLRLEVAALLRPGPAKGK